MHVLLNALQLVQLLFTHLFGANKSNGFVNQFHFDVTLTMLSKFSCGQCDGTIVSVKMAFVPKKLAFITASVSYDNLQLFMTIQDYDNSRTLSTMAKPQIKHVSAIYELACPFTVHRNDLYRHQTKCLNLLK